MMCKILHRRLSLLSLCGQCCGQYVCGQSVWSVCEWSPCVQCRSEATTPPELTGSRIASEAAARILFMAVRWVKSVPAFCRLSTGDQRVLLQNGWRELFLLTAAQFSSAFSLQPAVASPSHLPGQSHRTVNLTPNWTYPRMFSKFYSDF